MNSKRRLPTIKQPRSQQASSAKLGLVRKTGPQISVPTLTCLMCGEQFEGPSAVRLRHGCIRHRKWGAEFIELPFDDRTLVKWVCIGCAKERLILSDGVLRFSSLLRGLSADGHCCLCDRDIEPYPLEEWSSMIRLEVGTMRLSTKGPFVIFQAKEVGHVHYMCMDDINIELWRLIEMTDTPDFGECLP